MPQEGLTNNPGTDELMVESLKRGAKAVGAAPELRHRPCRADPPRVRDGARIRCRHRHASRLRHLAGASGLRARVRADRDNTNGAAASRSGMRPSSRPWTCRSRRNGRKRLADAGVAVTVLPATDLFLMGRERDYNVRRGLVDANLFVECGCNCSLSSNNIMNPFTPFGNGSLIRMTNLHANTLQIGHAERIAECFEMITTRSAKLMNLKDYGIKVGNPADVTVLEATSPRQAVAEIARADRRVQARQAHGDAAPDRTASPHLATSTSHMATRTLRVAMEGVTGRLGTNQHLIRSVLAIRNEGGLPLRGTATVSCPSRFSSAAIRTSCRRSPPRTAAWSGRPTALRRSRTRRSTSTSMSRRRAGGSSAHCRRSRPASTSIWRSRSPARSQEAMTIVRAAQAAGVKAAAVQDKVYLPGFQKLRKVRDSGFFGRILSARLDAAGGCSTAISIRCSARAGTTARRMAAGWCSTCIRTGATCWRA